MGFIESTLTGENHLQVVEKVVIRSYGNQVTK